MKKILLKEEYLQAFLNCYRSNSVKLRGLRELMQNYDILVVGNGVLGLSTAYALTLEDPSLKIAVVGPSHRRGGASVSAGAMLNCFAEVNKFTFKSKHSLLKFNIALQSMRLWPKWLEQINVQQSPHQTVKYLPGTHIILNTRAGKREDENFSAIQTALKIHYEPYEEIDPRDIPSLNPADDSRPLKALYLPNEGSLNPVSFLKALERCCIQSGQVTLIDDVVSRIIVQKEKVIGVETKGQLIVHASKVLIAAGAYSQSLIDKIPSLVHRIPKILHGRGTSIVLKVPNHQCKTVVRTPVRAGSCGIHILPYGEKDQLYMGASNCLNFKPSYKAQTRDVYYLLERAFDQFDQNLHKARIVKLVTGNRPVSIDTYPLIGSTSIEGLSVLAGTYRDGFHDSPLLSTSMAKDLLDRTPLLTPEFKPERRPIEVMSKEESIAEWSDQYVSAGYEHSMKFPKQLLGPLQREMTYKYIESLYEQLGIDFGLSPDVFFMFEAMEPDNITLLKNYFQRVNKEFSSYPRQMGVNAHVS